jgi:hypothetical protein
MRRKLRFLPLLLLPLLANGCVTHKLWTASALDEWNEPAPNPNLRLFEDTRRNDLLVVYSEFSERHSATCTRAFYLQQNLKPLAHHARLHFVNAHAAAGLAPVPVFCPAPTAPPGGIYAVATTNMVAFAVFSDHKETGTYELPVYADGVGQRERIALTPVAVTIDATIIGGAAGCLFLYAMANNGDAWRP